jgi:hemolysin activation/secretion protein
MTSVFAAFVLAAQSLAAPMTPPLIEQGRDQDRPQIPGAGDRSTLPKGSVAVDVESSAVAIEGIDFVGIDAPAIVAEAARPFLGRPASRETLAALAKAISDAYGKTGIALYTVAIPQQDLSTGHVKVLLAEGFVEEIAYPKGASPLVRAYAEKLRKERPLPKRTLERSLSLIRDIPGAKADVAVQRGQGVGAVKFEIIPTRKHSDFSVGINNIAQAGLGRGQVQASVQGYSLLQDGDRTDLVVLSAIDFQQFKYVALSHQAPLGSDGLTLGLSGSYLDTHAGQPAIAGQAWTAGVSLAYPVIRSYRRNLSVSIGLDGLNSDAALLSSVLSSDRIRAVRGAAAYSLVTDKSVLTAGVALARGLDILGARTTLGVAETAFTKIVCRLGYDRMIGKAMIVRLRASGQYSGDRVPANERFAIGGPDLGRAFETATVSGDRGFGGSLEFALRPKLPEQVKGSEVYAFVDGARLHILSRASFAAASYGLASTGGGVRIAYNPHAWLELEGARVIEKPFPASAEGWRFNINWRLKLRA